MVYWLDASGFKASVSSPALVDFGAGKDVVQAPESVGGGDGFPFEIVGFDCAGACERMGGRPERYMRMLGLFIDSNKDKVSDCRVALEQGDRGGAQRAAHSIKGTSATVGAMPLHAMAKALEAHIKEGGDDSAVDDMLLHYEEEFQRTLKLISDFLAQQAQ